MTKYQNLWGCENQNNQCIKFFNLEKLKNKKTCDDNEKCSGLKFEYIRYFPYDKFKKMLNENELAFINPILWDDPFERLYLNTKIVLGDQSYVPKKVFCLCGRNTNNNEAALWETYSKKDEPVVRVKFHVDKLFKKIAGFAEDKNCRVYCCKIIYVNKDKIQDLKWIKDYIRGDNLEDNLEKKYISLMSLKRLSFNYEKECRLFIVPNDDQNESFKNDVLKVPIGKEVFKRFTISPLEEDTQNENNNQETEEQKRAREQKEQEKKEKWLDVENIIKGYISDTDAIVSKTRLYKAIVPIREINL